MVWMPTLSARHHIGFFGGSHFGASMRARADAVERKTTEHKTLTGLSVLDAHSALLPGVREILELITAADICLSTGHLSLPEIRVLVKEARSIGVRKILITHPDLALSGMSLEDQQALAADGAILEKDTRESRRRTSGRWSRKIQQGSWESTRGFEEVTRRRTPHRWQGRIAGSA